MVPIVAPSIPKPSAPAPALPSWAHQLEELARPYAHATAEWTKHAVHWSAQHTGLPVAVVSALGIVLAWRVVRRTWYVVFEIVVAFTLLFAATRLGWIHW